MPAGTAVPAMTLPNEPTVGIDWCLPLDAEGAKNPMQQPMLWSTCGGMQPTVCIPPHNLSTPPQCPHSCANMLSCDSPRDWLENQFFVYNRLLNCSGPQLVGSPRVNLDSCTGQCHLFRRIFADFESETSLVDMTLYFTPMCSLK